jgi:hypothetical protein
VLGEFGGKVKEHDGVCVLIYIESGRVHGGQPIVLPNTNGQV